jgi:spore maturation protein CgeB
MRVVYFTHSLLSCWNHGNAHFLRGVLRELIHRGHEVRAYEPRDAWSLQNLLADHGQAGLGPFREAYPELSSERYGPDLDLEEALEGADLVIVHEWNEPALVAAVGEVRARGGRFTLLFHDTHHRAVSDPEAIRRFDLTAYDGVLAFGETLAEVYRRWGWGRRVFVWHEAADTRLFRPRTSPLEGEVDGRRPSGAGGTSTSPDRAAPPPSPQPSPIQGEGERQGLVFIGNWGDGERSAELERFLFAPARQAGLPLDIYGVRYPEAARATLKRHGARYHGWLPNPRAPEVFARHLATVHVPRRFYAEILPGIPTIRVFEALACGIPLVSAPWDDAEGLFRPGQDYLVAETGSAMARHMAALRDDAALRESVIASGLETIRARHSCAHRVDELIALLPTLGRPAAAAAPLESPACVSPSTARASSPPIGTGRPLTIAAS